MGDAALRFGRCELRPVTRELLIDGQPAPIGARAFDLLGVLVEHRDRVVAKGELLDLVWPGLVVEENNLQVQVSTLRKLLGAPAISTVPGRGYRFTLPLDGTTPAPAPATATAPPPALGIAGPALLGRDEELRLALELLQSHRLVTVTGPGGIGKTRLARALLQAWLARGADGVGWVDLSPLDDAALLPAAAARGLGLRLESGGDPAAALEQALARRTLLLVLDNCEHLVGAARRSCSGC